MSVFRGLFLVLLVFYVSSASTYIHHDSENEVDQLIIKTDQLKSSEKSAFKERLQKLKKLHAIATQEQQEYIDYLGVYQIVLDGNLDAAQLAFEKLFEHTNSLQVKINIKATLANIQAISREYNKSLLNLDDAINMAEQLGQLKHINRVNLISAMVYYLMDIYDMSIKYSDLVLNKDPGQIMVCKAESVNLRSKLKLGENIPQERLHDVIGICDDVELSVYANITKLEWLHAELNKAYLENDTQLMAVLLSLVKKSTDSIEKSGYNNLIGLKDMVLAKAYLYNNDLDSAQSNAQKSIEGSKDAGNTMQVVEALKIILQEAKTRDDYKKAFELSEQINRVQNEIYSEAKAKQLAYMTVKHDILARELEIKQLSQDNEVLALQNKLAVEVSRKQSLLVALISLLLLLLGFWTYRIKKRQIHFKKISEIDHLTQVFSRKAFEERMNDLIKTCKKNNMPLNLAILDLDFFKNINDQFGHPVGDWVLQRVVLACESVVDEDLLMARLGGEEFVLVAPKDSFLKFMQLLEKMRLAIEQMDCDETGHDIKVTASFGVTSSFRSGYELSKLMADADSALFEAKNGGRNQIKTYENRLKIAR